AAVLEAERAPGDVAVLHPWWSERARLFVPAAIPVVGYLGATGDDLLAHPRIWVLANERLPFVPDADFRARFLPDRTPLGAPRRFGPLTLTPYRNGRARAIRFSAVDELAQAEVSIESPGAASVPCSRSGDAFLCRAGRAAPAWHEVPYQPQRRRARPPRARGPPPAVALPLHPSPRWAGTDRGAISRGPRRHASPRGGHHLGACLEARAFRRPAHPQRPDRSAAPAHPPGARGPRLR